MLNDDERAIIRSLWTRGPAALYEKNYSEDMVQAFLARDDVKAELDLYSQEQRHSDALVGRSQFIAKRSLSQLAPGAVAIIGQALAGPTYRRDASGNIMNDAKGHPIQVHPEPTRGQLKAADLILERIGVEGDGVKVSITALSEGPLNDMVQKRAMSSKPKLILDGSLATEKERAVSRERTRTAIEILAHKALPAALKRIEAHLAGKKAASKKPPPSIDTVSKPKP